MRYLTPFLAVSLTAALSAQGTERIDTDAIAKIGENILAALDLEELADVPGRFLSAGQKRRLSLTRLLATPADLWLMDEPSITLDRVAAEYVC